MNSILQFREKKKDRDTEFNRSVDIRKTSSIEIIFKWNAISCGGVVRIQRAQPLCIA